MIGTLIFIYLEADYELAERKEKFHQIRNIYKMIMHEASTICRTEAYVTQATVLLFFLNINFYY